jgi:hypothetical protein
MAVYTFWSIRLKRPDGVAALRPVTAQGIGGMCVNAATPYRVFSKISRPISMRLISLVPAPIS